MSDRQIDAIVKPQWQLVYLFIQGKENFANCQAWMPHAEALKSHSYLKLGHSLVQEHIRHEIGLNKVC